MSERIARGDRVRILGPIASLAPKTSFIGRVLDVNHYSGIATIELEVRVASGTPREEGRLVSSHVSYLEKL